MSGHESGFTTEGYESFPSLYHDSERIHDITNWTPKMLNDRVTEYTEFLQRDELMPRARQTATRLLGQMAYELTCREAEGTHE